MKATSEDHYFARLRQLNEDRDIQALGAELREAGFTPMRRFLDEFRSYLRTCGDVETGVTGVALESGEAAELLKRAMLAVPEPGRISPSWMYIWREYASIIRTKSRVFRDVPPSEREGEWQVLLDNPFSNQNIAVYPGLTFMEAVYMFAYFRTDLANNEHIRLQKIATVMTCTGVESDGLQPIASL